jgi:murein DD-endopeptidase MepM/ murein hydrolase activator NlpD
MTNSNLYQYIIQPGDTIWNLANEYGLTVDDILAANPEVDPDNLMVGQVILIPTASQMMNNEQMMWGPWGGPWGGMWGGPWGAWGWRRGWW